ncbi:hypothetical protein SARC_15012 [Sphaeroforma arctica JP610]|uniref:Protein kinase domain-containing protein n=1 Tax=Sphaeroforma arctica JP610 TaxID=667725 RepID=A0A0L0F715_9EUKA|nr:hypothetical protein SARC_15012 [Sphaeroforma arctica JP610]KNC72429.1 hypothetical protein SARC_15012 [Sphaeroforma arctica JP610]|eukprot:XP_014146331.1 hypothetical protein SARC_15012 [Sphaeroforma arctica JP610]
MSNATTPRQGALNVLTCSNPGGVFDPALRSPSGPERGTSAYTINPTSPNSMRRIPHTNAPEGAIPSAHRTSVASISLVSKSMASSIADTFMQQQQQQQHGGGPVHAQLKGGRSGLRQQKSSGSVGSVGSIGTIGPRGSQPNLDQLLQQNMQQQSQHNKGLQYNSAQQQSLAQLTSQQQLRLPSRVRRSSHARSDTGGHESTSKHKQSLVQLPNQGLTTSRSTGQMMGNRRKSMDVACMSQGVNIDELPAVKKESSVLSMRRSRSSTFSLWGDKKEKKNPADEFKKIEGKQRTLSVTSKDKDNNPSSGETRVVGDYILGETIGKGRYSIVKIASHRITKEKVAVKIVNKRKLSKEDLRVLKRYFFTTK